MQVVNLFGDDWSVSRERDGWLWNRLDVGKSLGAELFGASVYEIEPGQKELPVPLAARRGGAADRPGR